MKERKKMTLRSIVLVLTLAVAGSLYAQPKIQITGGNKFDFGDIHRGQKVERKVVVKNTGSELLELGRVDVSCGCTGTVVTNGSIPPGKSGEVLITFNSTNFTGKIHKTVTVNSNAPGGPTVVEFEGNVIQLIAVDPQQFWFKDAEVGRATTSKVTLTNNSAEPVSLTGYQSTCAGLTLVLPKGPIKPGGSVELVASLKAPTATQVLNESVSVRTTNKEEADLYIRIFGAVKEFKFQ